MGIDYVNSVINTVQPLGINAAAFYSSQLDKYQKIKKIILENYPSYHFETLKQLNSSGWVIVRVNIIKEKSNNWVLEIEDISAVQEVILKKEIELEEIQYLLPGCIVAMYLTSKHLKEILFPDITHVDVRTPNIAVTKKVFYAIMSDIHVGAHTFVKDAFIKSINYINSRLEIKYLLICGDAVDGIQVYPGHESALYAKTIDDQYKELAELLSVLRDDITCIISPGNHDTVVSIYEPQPSLPPSIQKLFKTSTLFVPNPAFFYLEGVRILMYHGTSIDNLVLQCRAFSYDSVGLAMRFLLQCRHLFPNTTLRNTVKPGNLNPMVIDVIPHIFITGHVHHCSAQLYKGVALLNSGTWQQMTAFQKVTGMVSEVGYLTIANLHNRAEVEKHGFL